LAEQVVYHRGSPAESEIFKERLKRASVLMEGAGVDAILLTKPQNMTYLVGDGRLCAFTIITQETLNNIFWLKIFLLESEPMRQFTSKQGG